MMQCLPVIQVSDLVIRFAKIVVYSKFPVLEMDLEKDQAQPDEELQPVALGDVLLHGLRASIDDPADPLFDLTSHQRVAVLAAGDFEASVLDGPAIWQCDRPVKQVELPQHPFGNNMLVVEHF